MTTSSLAEVTAGLPRALGWDAPLLDVRVRNLRGGLVADSVLLVSARCLERTGESRTAALVIKQLDASTAREARIYEALACTPLRRFMPNLLGVQRSGGPGPRLLLEALEPRSAWPWQDIECAGRVLDVLASLHRIPSCMPLEACVADWDYEHELQQRAEHSLELLTRSAGRGPPPVLGAGIRATRRLVKNLPQLRCQLMECGPLTRVLIHGDVHPGNATILAGDRGPVLYDWARARVGSPFEDVSSWLQWLGFWEPAVKRKHDTLLGRYLAAVGLASTPSHVVRAAYWLAAASNCLAGALSYHLQSELDGAECAVRGCLRMIRRADAYWQGSYRSLPKSTSKATSAGP